MVYLAGPVSQSLSVVSLRLTTFSTACAEAADVVVAGAMAAKTSASNMPQVNRVLMDQYFCMGYASLLYMD
jgi:hypothetical protein